MSFDRSQIYYQSDSRDFTLIGGDCRLVLPSFEYEFDMIFADPPYFLSNGGISYQSGEVVCVDKGEWDKGLTEAEQETFTYEWLRLCRSKLKPNGTIWVSGTHHNIFMIADVLKHLNYKLLNVITWAKTNPPPNVSCRFFTHSTEFILWARREAKVPHYFDYKAMKASNGDKQMTDVWSLPAIGRWEKSCGKHPTQKPLPLLYRIITASTQSGACILDPFSGSATTGIAANLAERNYVGIEAESAFLEMSKRRRLELNEAHIGEEWLYKIERTLNK